MGSARHEVNLMHTRTSYLSLGSTYHSCSIARRGAMFILCQSTTCTYTVGCKFVRSAGSLVFGDYGAARSSETDPLTQIAGY